MFHKLLDPMVLEVNLRLLFRSKFMFGLINEYCFRSVWAAGVQDTEDKEISNKWVKIQIKLMLIFRIFNV